MKTITLLRRDFKESVEANFFEDILYELNISKKNWDNINEIEITVKDYILSD